MQVSYRLVACDSIKSPVRIDTTLLPEFLPYLRSHERLVLVPRRDLEISAQLLRTAGTVVSIGADDESLAQLPSLSALAA
jgi:hypothetical protein